ncbi:MAG: DUF2911 domain-containing protein [Acidobacteria bacterium]|nr:MAG: DUF2911 domain-containing protein [Acidobacteriota bacterium]
MATRSMWIAGLVAMASQATQAAQAPPAAAAAAMQGGGPSAVAAQVPAGQPAAQRARRAPTRGTASATLGAHEIELAHPLTSVDSAEFAELESLGSGGVVRFFSAPALRLRNDVSLRFGEQEVPTGNVAPDFDGIYSLWIRRTAEGWELLFNDQGDVWGTQHDPAADRAAAPLLHELTAEDDAEQAFTADLAWTADAARGTLVLAWGRHRWSAPFTLAEPP